MSKLYKIGLTGGIGSGKSRLLDYLAKASPRIYPINLDLFGHAVYQLNPLVLRNVATIFGASAVHSDGQGPVSIRREVLGRLVFESQSNLLALRQLVSPEIKRLLKETILEVEASGKYDILAVEGAVLIEANTHPMFDEIWVTTLDKELAVQRVVQRNPQLGEKQARERVSSQITDEERLKYASFHYDTSAPWEYNQSLIDYELRSLRLSYRLNDY